MIEKNDWHLIESSEAVRLLSSDRYKGLHSKEAKSRKNQFGENSVWKIKRISTKDVVLSTVFDLSTILLIVTAGAAALFDKSFFALAIVLILLLGGLLRALAFVRANRIFEEVLKDKIPSSIVIRDGRHKLLHANEIVPGDIIFLSPGDIIPCDGRVLSQNDSTVSEIGITENKAAVHKFDTTIRTESDSGEVPVEYRSNMVFAGSEVQSGTLRIVAVSTGDDTLIGMKHGGVELSLPGHTPEIDKLSAKSKITSLIMLTVVLVITMLSLFSGGRFTLPDIFLGAMAMMVASMSEFLASIGYVVIAVTVRDSAFFSPKHSGDISQKRAMIREPGLIEKMSSPKRIVFVGTSFFKSGKFTLPAYRAKSKYEKNTGSPSSELVRLISLANSAAALNSAGLSGSSDEIGKDDDPQKVIISRATEICPEYGSLSKEFNYSIIDHVSFCNISGSEETNISLILEENTVHAVACGSVRDILSYCTTQETEDGTAPLSEKEIRRIFTECAKLEFRGAKLMAVAKKPSQYTTLKRLPALICEMTFIGFFAVFEEAEPSAKENISFIKENGITPILFTSSPEADLYYCHGIGLFNKHTKILKYRDLKRGFHEPSTNGYIVSFADVDIAHIRKAYEKAIRLMTGDSSTMVTAEDIAASGAASAADIFVAVAKSPDHPVPEPLAKNAAATVYPSSMENAACGGLCGTVNIIKSAQRALNNLTSVEFYLIVSQISRLIIMLSSVLFGSPLLSPVFILFCGLIIDFMTVLSMAFENTGGYLKSKQYSTVKSLVSGAVLGTINSAFIITVEYIFEILHIQVATGALTAILSASIILSTLATSLEIIKRESIFSVKRINLAHFSTSVVALLSAAAIMFTEIGAELAGGAPCGMYASLSMFPPLLVIICSEIFKIVQKNKQKNNK